MNWRYRFTLFFFLLLFALIIIRLFYWQVVRAQELSAIGQAQYDEQVVSQAQRGEIKTSDGFTITANKLAYLVYANPKVVKDKVSESDVLGKLLDIKNATVSALLSENKFWVPIKSAIDNSVKDKIDAQKLPGIGFEEHTVRFYPEASMAAQLLGFVGKDESGNDKGYFGLEGYYNRLLSGKNGFAIVVHDAGGHPILAKMNDSTVKVDGRTLILNIDRRIQFMLDTELKKGIETYGAKSGMAAVMDPKTGGILAMSSFPEFDPAHYQDSPESFYANPFITSAYEPGSTFKPLIMAAAMNEGLVKPDTRCTICSGPVQIGGYAIHTWDDHYSPNTTMTDVIVHSDNTGMVFIGQKLGLNHMLDYLQRYGIGNTTGIDLQGEEAPAIHPRNEWYPIDLATATFGQGIIVTPIELLDAISAIANNGKRMEPHIVAAVQTPDGQTISIPPKIIDQPISQTTAQVMTQIMVNAVNNGEAKFARLKGYDIAGKTGTAQIPVAGHYDPTKTIASFVGFAPANDPKFIMLVVLNQPSASIYGAETAAPIFFTVAKDIFTYYGIPPNE
ncbi:MAG TPA: penicillin-binding protein 2 [Candidatus Sulfotelmatobacter sp.]|jgi:stage V sporulation protein D (sporulation-specific penicillin-binding protein)|nr:penicillin-binding protein 2 [Candidatus Sulfotelmatobacter sp.]